NSALICCSTYDVACLRNHWSFFLSTPRTTKIYTLSLHDALPIYSDAASPIAIMMLPTTGAFCLSASDRFGSAETSASLCSSTSRSEEHTSELQSLAYLVCRLLLEKKKPFLYLM